MASATWLFRRDTAVNWTSVDPTLLSGELGLETDTLKLKIGDGINEWTVLGYIAATAAGAAVATDVIWDAAGDLAVGTGADTAAKVNIGAEEVVARIGAGNVDGITMAEQTVLGRLTGASIDDVVIGIADNNMVQIDQADAATGEYAKFTANGIESKSFTEVKQDLDLEIGTDVLAQQTIGIANDNLVEIDGADIADDEYARFTAAGLESRTASEVFTDLLAQVMLENDSLKLDVALSADGKYSGITETGVAGATLAFGNVIYQAVGDTRWELAKADATATSIMRLGICVQVAAADASATTILLWGKVRADAVFPAFTAYAPVFISEATAGILKSAAPATATNVVRCVGHAITADELMFTPDNVWVVVA